jgi:hypothetical protein
LFRNGPSYSRYNDLAVEKQRVEQENNSLRLFVEEERKELEEMRRQQQVGDSWCIRQSRQRTIRNPTNVSAF